MNDTPFLPAAHIGKYQDTVSQQATEPRAMFRTLLTQLTIFTWTPTSRTGQLRIMHSISEEPANSQQQELSQLFRAIFH